jgi:hypothetical protein
LCYIVLPFFWLLCFFVFVSPQAVAVGPTKITLEWPAADGRGAPVTQYRLEAGAVAPMSVATGEEGNGSATAAATAFSCIWSGDKLGTEVKSLLPNTTYIFRVQVFVFLDDFPRIFYNLENKTGVEQGRGGRVLSSLFVCYERSVPQCPRICAIYRHDYM